MNCRFTTLAVVSSLLVSFLFQPSFGFVTPAGGRLIVSKSRRNLQFAAARTVTYAAMSASMSTSTSAYSYSYSEHQNEYQQQHRNQNQNHQHELRAPAPVFLEDAKDILPEPAPGNVRCVILSDTHGRHYDLSPLPHGDVLIHLGDVADQGKLQDIRSFAEYLDQQSHPEKILVQGNHDRDLQHPDRIDLRKEYDGVAHLLKDQVVDVAGGRLRIYGASWESCEQDDFHFDDNKSDSRNNKSSYDDFDLDFDFDFDFFLTHSTPFLKNGGHGWEGSQKITDIVEKGKIPVHLCGHVHWGRGIRQINDNRSILVNCCTSWNQPVVIDWDPVYRRTSMVYCPRPKIIQKFGSQLFVLNQ